MSLLRADRVWDPRRQTELTGPGPRQASGVDVERGRPRGLAVRADHDLLDPRLGELEQGLAMLLESFSTLVDLDGFLELDIAALEALHDGFELLEGLFEGEGLDRCDLGHAST